MVASTYTSAMKHLRRDEGGYVNHPSDPGGATNHGVTQAVYDAQRKRLGLKTRSVRDITEAEVEAIYRAQYADKVRYDDLPAGVDYATLDAAVNSGVSRGAKWLQASIGVSADGAVGPQTVAKAKASHTVKTVKAICSRRLAFVQSLKTWSVFGRGWGRRIAGVEANAVAMALAAGGMSAHGIAAVAKAESDVASANAKAQKTAAGSTAVPAATSAGSAAVTDVSTATVVALCVVAAVLVVGVIYFVRKSGINRDRAEAYAAVAEETLHA